MIHWRGSEVACIGSVPKVFPMLCLSASGPHQCQPARESEDGGDDCQGQGWDPYSILLRIRLGESQFKNRNQTDANVLPSDLFQQLLAGPPACGVSLACLPPFPQFDSSSSFHSAATMIFVKNHKKKKSHDCVVDSSTFNLRLKHDPSCQHFSDLSK